MSTIRVGTGRWRRFCAVAISLSATLGAFLCLLPSPALAVPVLTPVIRTDLSSSALVGGVVVPEVSTPLYFSPLAISAGAGRSRRVKAVHVRAGQVVSQGAVLAELDGDDLYQRLDQPRSALARTQEAQRQAEAARRAQEARLAQLGEQLSQAQSTAEKASVTAGQTQSRCVLLATSLVANAIEESASLPPPPPSPSLDAMPKTKAALAALEQCQADLAKESTTLGASTATAQLLQAQLSSLSSSRSQVSALAGQVSAARKNVEQVQRLIDALAISAPYDGVVSAVNIKEGGNLEQGIPAFEFRTTKLVARADLAEGDLLGVVRGSSALVSIRSAQIEFTTTVKSISEDPRGSRGGPVSYPAFFDLPPNPSIKPGQLVRVKIVVETRRGVLVVPSSAVTESKGLYYVLVSKDGRDEPRRVVPGLSDENLTEIVQGLEEGEMVRTLAPKL